MQSKTNESSSRIFFFKETQIIMFQENDYKKIILAQIEKQSSPRGYRSKLAQASGCQASFLTQVLKGAVHLTPEHGAAMCQFWGFRPDETEFFLLLVQAARAGNKPLKDHLAKKIEGLRKGKAKLSLSNRILEMSITKEADVAKYYAFWHMSAIHAIVSIPKYQTVEAIATNVRSLFIWRSAGQII